MVLEPRDRVALEEQLAQGKRVFAEYCRSLLDYYCSAPIVSRYERPVSVIGEEICGLQPGIILENQYNQRISPYYMRSDDEIQAWLRVPKHIRALRQTNQLPADAPPCLWTEQDNRVMYCTFRLENFIRARFAPREEWTKLICAIVKWICGCECDTRLISASYEMGAKNPSAPFFSQVLDAAERGIFWYRHSGVLPGAGENGIWEGVRSEITPDGKQTYNTAMRADCIGESAFPFFLRYMLCRQKDDLAVSDALTTYMFENFFTRKGRFAGMIRWTSEAWTVCYQDDVARAVFPVLWRRLLTGEAPYFAETLKALDFLVDTTGSDGLRRERTDNFYLDGDKLALLKDEPGKSTSPNYNGYYFAALLLAYRLCGKEAYLNTAVKGLTTMMAAYPNLQRIQSETHDVCRMILPLSYLYWITGEKKHKDWLYLVTKDMEKMKHPCGAYLEWDSNYSAQLHDADEDSESAVFSRNGDPIVDCLYAVNWLPIAWLHAYAITGDNDFLAKWKEIAGFFVKTQIHSEDRMLHGAWVRAVDVERMEINGLPDDVGWGPWCIETGWSMSQIVSGLYWGLLHERCLSCFAQ